jgi:hypothetical protein
LFDPFLLASDPSINALNALADELVHFVYPEFDEDFINELKKEIPEAIKYAKNAFDWDKVEGSKKYRERVLIRARRGARGRDFWYRKVPGVMQLLWLMWTQV